MSILQRIYTNCHWFYTDQRLFRIAIPPAYAGMVLGKTAVFPKTNPSAHKGITYLYSLDAKAIKSTNEFC